MNIFKELVLGQKDKKRMGKWIRQGFFLIAGRLISSGRKFILKLQEDWVYIEEYKEAEGRLRDWLGLPRREEVVRRRQKRQGRKTLQQQGLS